MPVSYSSDGLLVHPALYIGLVNAVTEKEAWQLICNQFHSFGFNAKVKCLSLPVESLTDQSDKAEQVSNWWQTFEQKSLELSLDYEFIAQSDIVDCYAAIYTHSIAWALHTKEIAKKERNNKSLVGNIIDDFMKDMRQGQTNGIPQGSVLMDFVAEMVLGYADIELTNKLANENIEDYQVLRYRDDYRIFVNSSQTGERILKCLTEVMIDLGLKLGTQKTGISDAVIRSSIKEDKLNWMFRRHGDKNMQKHLLVLHDHSVRYPNSGSLVIAMQDYHKRLGKREMIEFPMPLAAIVVDIALHNPRTYAISVAILSKILRVLETAEDKASLIEKIKVKFSLLPNTGHMQIWLQRISLRLSSVIDFDEPLCRLVNQENADVWNSDWITYDALKKAVDARKIVNSAVLNGLEDTVSDEEVALFRSGYNT